MAKNSQSKSWTGQFVVGVAVNVVIVMAVIKLGMIWFG